LEEYTSWFTQTGLKKRSIIKTEKIAVIHNSIAKKKLGKLPDEILVEVKGKLRKALNI
jgi:mRNA interferase MazF